MELIVTEKDNAARRLSEILSGEDFDTERRAGVNVYRWGGTRCIGLSGHVVAVDFPPEYDDWRDVEPVELIDAPVRKRPTQEDIVRALRLLSREADRVVIATDYDREGELIGKEAYELIREVNEDVPVDRVRFSSITEREVTEAFENRDEIDFDLAAAGEARQIIDLIWGASLTRFLSLSARQLGNDFISVGRVQGPTLKLIVDREREIEAFDPEDYWELFADLLKAADDVDEAFEAQYFYEDDDGTEAERVWDEATAEAVYGRLREAETATVASVRRRSRTDEPPAPFNTTQFIRAASSIGYSAQRAMSIAEDLYTAGSSPTRGRTTPSTRRTSTSANCSTSWRRGGASATTPSRCWTSTTSPPPRATRRRPTTRRSTRPARSPRPRTSPRTSGRCTNWSCGGSSRRARPTPSGSTCASSPRSRRATTPSASTTARSA